MNRLCTLLTLAFFYIGSLEAAIYWSKPSELTSKNSLIASNNEGTTLVAHVNPKLKKIEIAEYLYASDQLGDPIRIAPCSAKTRLLQMELLDDGNVFLLFEDPDTGCFQAAKYNRRLHIWSEAWVMPSEDVSELVLDCDDHGNAMLSWIHFDGYLNQVHADYFSSKEQRWKSSHTLSNPGLDSPNKQFAFDSKGNGVLCWNYVQESGKKSFIHGIQALRFDSASEEWGNAPFLKDPVVNNKIAKPRAIFDENDNIFLCWENTNLYFSSTKLQYVHYDFSTKRVSFKKEIPIDGTILDFSLLKYGSRMCLICHSSSSQVEALQCIHLTADPGDASHVFEEIPIPFTMIGEYKINVDRKGKVTLLIANNDRLEVAQFDTRWENIAIFERQKCPREMKIQFDSMGNALLIWETEDKTYYSRGNYLLPPHQFAARFVEKRFATRKVQLVQLNWNDPLSPALTKFKIRKNNEEVIELPANRFVFVDPYPPIGRVVYTIVSVNEEGKESAPAELIIQ